MKSILVILDKGHYDSNTIEFLLQGMNNFELIFLNNLRITKSTTDLVLYPTSLGKSLITENNLVEYGTGKSEGRYIDLSWQDRDSIKREINDYLSFP